MLLIATTVLLFLSPTSPRLCLLYFPPVSCLFDPLPYRYQAHHSSQQIAEKQQDTTERRMVELQEAVGSAWIDVQFLKTAVEQLIECRRVLKWVCICVYILSHVDGG